MSATIGFRTTEERKERAKARVESDPYVKDLTHLMELALDKFLAKPQERDEVLTE